MRRTPLTILNKASFSSVNWTNKRKRRQSMRAPSSLIAARRSRPKATSRACPSMNQSANGWRLVPSAYCRLLGITWYGFDSFVCVYDFVFCEVPEQSMDSGAIVCRCICICICVSLSACFCVFSCVCPCVCMCLE